MHSRSCGDCISMWFAGCKVNRSNRSIFLDKDRALKGPPISGFYAMFFWGRLCMFAWDDGLVIHARRAQFSSLLLLFGFSDFCRSRVHG